METFLRYCLLSGLGALLGGCSVYVPMLGAAPEIRQKGELEVTGAWSLTNRVDASATYSPLRHLLVRAAVSSKGGGHQEANDSASFAQNNQYELNVGTYWPLGKQWLLGGLAGFGQAHSQARYTDDGDVSFNIFGYRQPIRHQFDAIYAKYSAEIYGTWQASEWVSLGLACRLVQLRLTDVTDRYVPVQAGPIVRYEPMLYLRVRPNGGPVQCQAALGTSATFGYDGRRALDQADPARQFRLGYGYASLGIAFYPHLLWQGK
ncbi:hypothetical protein GKZ68_01480 [Hymenobacter sp. BRD128]|uniref:hypothetical protein n=1 Tax=Hymenobacter sp. BRD128 TaxID=2675878 RepID=UPI00156770F9|nr:hypothetical protein [Hymenobacter sp. BRD128]QKG55425.1 hypothetical protein GKZ68_01480 [Hymenobacter sp. BRD128]